MSQDPFTVWADAWLKDMVPSHAFAYRCIARYVWDAAVAAERERCASVCDGIAAGYAGAARRLDGKNSTHAAGQRDGANECAATIRRS